MYLKILGLLTIQSKLFPFFFLHLPYRPLLILRLLDKTDNHTMRLLKCSKGSNPSMEIRAFVNAVLIRNG
jgi:hypothetical protein